MARTQSRQSTALLLALLSLQALVFPLSHARGSVFARDAVEKVFIVEESSEALCLWYAAGIRSMPLVHISERPGFFSRAVQIECDIQHIRDLFDKKPCEEASLPALHTDHKAKLYGNDDFIFAAFQLGIVGEVWWIVPRKETLRAEDFAVVKERLRVLYGLPLEFTENLTHDGRLIRGNFRGLPVRILAFRDLPAFDRPVLLNIDTEWFLNLYQNPVKESMLDLAGGFFKTLQQKGLQGTHAVIARSVNDGSTPLHFRYLAGYIRDLLNRPGEFTEGPPLHWRLQGRIEYLDFLLARDEALEEGRRFAELEPDSPVPWYDLSYIAASRGDVKGAQTGLREAVQRDRAYALGYVTISTLLADSRKPVESLALLEDGYRSWPGDLNIARSLGRRYMGGRMYRKAGELYEDLLSRFPGVPDLHADYAVALWMEGEREKAGKQMKSYRAMAHPGLSREQTIGRWEVLTSMPAVRDRPENVP